jgi:hypothetical protein
LSKIKETKLRKRKEIKRPWWYVFFRSMHYYAFRYWGIFLLGFFFLGALWVWLCYLPYCENNIRCCRAEEYTKKVLAARQDLEECCNCNPGLSINDKEIDELRRDYGGRTGEVTITLAWQTTDDLDLHIVEPGGEEIYFENKVSRSGGRLDVDKNAGEDLTYNPIENVFYSSKPPRGKYGIYVHYYGANSGDYAVPYVVYVNIGGQQKQISGTHYTSGDVHAIYEFIIP